MDFSRYPDWNPFITQIEGEARDAQKLKATIQPPGQKPMVFRPRVVRHQPGQEFRWLGHLGIPGLFDGEHYFCLEELGPRRCKLIHGENLSGILTSWILKRIGSATRRGFEAMNAALKNQAESEPDRRV
jgi:hypothetical protein